MTTFIVICRGDSIDGERGAYELATRTVFNTKESATYYADGISSSREPIVIEGRFDDLRFNDGRFERVQ